MKSLSKATVFSWCRNYLFYYDMRTRREEDLYPSDTKQVTSLMKICLPQLNKNARTTQKKQKQKEQHLPHSHKQLGLGKIRVQGAR